MTLRALSQNFLEVDGAGSVFCGLSRRRSSSGDASGEAAGERTMEFVLHRMGISSATKRTGKIRCGGAICLRPVSEDLEAPPRKYLRWVPDRSGMLVADGNILDREISFTINQVQIQSVIEPMSARLQSGDADIKYARVCDKRTTLHHEALEVVGGLGCLSSKTCASRGGGKSGAHLCRHKGIHWPGGLNAILWLHPVGPPPPAQRLSGPML